MGKTDQTTNKAPYEYNNKYLTDDSVNKSLAAIQQQFGYDPAQDRGLHSAQKQAQATVTKHMASRGMLYSDSAKAKMQSEAQNLIPQYEQMAYGRFQDERQNQYNLLAQKSQLEGLNYNQFKDLQNFEIEQYGTVLTPEMRKHIQTYSSLPEQMKRDLENTYGNDFHAEINRRKEINPNDQIIPILESMRANKILKDPGRMSQYGSQYGIATPALAERGAKFDTVMAERQIATIKAKYAEQVEKGTLDRITQDLEMGKYDLAIAKAKAANAPEMMQLELAQMKANLAQTQKSTALMGRSSGGSGGIGDMTSSVTSMKNALLSGKISYRDANGKEVKVSDSYDAVMFARTNADRLQSAGLTGPQVGELIQDLEKINYVNLQKDWGLSSPHAVLGSLTKTDGTGLNQYREAMGETNYVKMVSDAQKAINEKKKSIYK